MYLIVNADFEAHYRHSVDETDIEMAQKGMIAIINLDTSEQISDEGEWVAVDAVEL